MKVAALAVAVVAASIAPARGGQTLYELRQAETMSAVYFYNAQDKGLVFGARSVQTSYGISKEHFTNVIVYLDKNDRTGNEIRSKVDAWIDARGHVHSLGTLRQQVRFNALLEGQAARLTGPDAASVRLQLEPIRSDVSVSTLPLTGILDPRTARIPYYRALFRLEAARRRFMRHCGAIAPGNECLNAQWPNALFTRLAAELNAASSAIDELKTCIDDLPFAWHGYPIAMGPYYPADGLDDAPEPSGSEVSDPTFGGLIGPRPRAVRMIEDLNPETERSVEQSVGPTVAAAPAFGAISRNETRALEAIDHAEMFMASVWGEN